MSHDGRGVPSLDHAILAVQRSSSIMKVCDHVVDILELCCRRCAGKRLQWTQQLQDQRLPQRVGFPEKLADGVDATGQGKAAGSALSYDPERDVETSVD